MVALSRCLLLFATILLVGCRSGPRAQTIAPPSSAIDTAMQQANEPAIFSDGAIPEQWWVIFDDQQLNAIVETALSRNPTLQSAETKVCLAVTQARQARSSLYPNLDWDGDISRQKLSETGLIPFNPNPKTASNTPTPAPTTFGLIPVYFTQYETEMLLTYDFDLWGKNRNTLKAALGEVQARLADEAFVRLQFGIAVATAYFRLQIDYQRLHIAQAFEENRRKNAQLTQQRVVNNIDDRQTLNQAESALTLAEESVLALQMDIEITQHQLKAYLSGNFDEEFANIEIMEQPLPKVPVPRELPLHLIARRPDLIAQLWLIESAGKQIEVAQAGFYPDVNIAAFWGFQTLHLHKLFFQKSSYFNVDPAFSLPIFNAGLLQANLRASEINYDLAIYDYNNMVLNATKEVLDGVTSVRTAYAQLEKLKKNIGYWKESELLIERKVKHNLASALDLLNSEAEVLMAQDRELIVLGDLLQADLGLIKALGGGYDICDNTYCELMVTYE